jgi:ketosteroid isomerase-like protein
MKISIAFTCVLVMMFACNKPTPKNIMPPVNNVAKNSAIIEQYFAQFNKHDWKAMADMYIDNPEMKDPAFGIANVKMTKADIIKKYLELHQMIPDVKDSVVAVYTSGNYMTVEFESSGTGPDGKKFSLPICTVFEIKEGKITKDFTYYDNVDEKK